MIPSSTKISTRASAKLAFRKHCDEEIHDPIIDYISRCGDEYLSLKNERLRDATQRSRFIYLFVQGGTSFTIFCSNRNDGNIAIISHSRYTQNSDTRKERSRAFLFDDPVAYL
jgi:hypothetical protein